MTIRPAATVLVLRPGSAGPEVLLLKRSGRAGFFPDAWVFPGGRVDPADGDVETRGAVAGLEEEPQWAVAALRETFEEAGIWLGDGALGADLRAALNRREASLAGAAGVVADLSRVRWLTWWVTPPEEPKRYDTRFFVVEVTRDEVAHATPCAIETVESRWMRPSRAVAAQRAGALFMAPPTVRVLEDLSEDLAAGRGVAATPPRHGIAPRLVGGRANPAAGGAGPPEGMMVVLPGDPTYPSEHPVSGPTRIVLRGGAFRSEYAPGCGPDREPAT